MAGTPATDLELSSGEQAPSRAAQPTAPSSAPAAPRGGEPWSTKEPDDAYEHCPEPTITARWSKPEVLPLHNTNWPPTDPPRDVVPDDAKVQMLVETTHVPDGTGAVVFIHHCHTDALVREGVLTNLVVRGGRVVHKTTGEPPEFVFTAEQMPWDPWAAPFFYFKVKVHHQGLATETPKDYEAREEQTLRVLYWHVCVADDYADQGGLNTGDEMKAIAAILRSPEHHRATDHVFFTERRIDPIVGSSAYHWPEVLKGCDVCKHFMPDPVQNTPGTIWGQCAKRPVGSEMRRVHDGCGTICDDFEADEELVSCKTCVHYRATGPVTATCASPTPVKSMAHAPDQGHRCPAYQAATFVYCKNCAYFEPDYHDPEQWGTCSSAEPYMGSKRQPAAVERNCPSYVAVAPGIRPKTPRWRGFRPRTTIARWGSLVRNTYSFVQASHGEVARLSLGGGTIRPADVQRSDDVPSVPRYLVFLSCCHAGAKPDLANAFLARGTRYVIAFGKKVADRIVRQFSKDFYESWVKTHKCDPDSIPDVFYATSAPYVGDLRPVLFGDGASQPVADLPGLA